MKKIIKKTTNRARKSSIDLDYLERWKTRPTEWKFEWLVAAKEFNYELEKNRTKKSPVKK